MKRVAIILLLALVAGCAAFVLTRRLAAPAEAGDHLAWMATEFGLTPAQRAAIAELEAAYAPVCEEHCANVVRARERLGAASGDEAAEAAAELARLEAVCTESTRAHLRAVAAHMEPDAARRFLALVEPKLAGHGHETPLALP